VDLRLDSGLARGYSSRAQIARVVTEKWVQEQVYCPACVCDFLSPTPSGTRVVDFLCEACGEAFQLKSQARPFGSRVTDAAYRPMIERIQQSSAPTFMLLHYQPDRWRVHDLFFVPRFFLSSSTIERRRPLSSAAHRVGWVGCNILLSSLPPDAKIPAVLEEEAIPIGVIRASWKRYAFLEAANPESRGWMADVLACVRGLRKEVFTLPDVYAFESSLARLHPQNRNIRPKIRQQLQVLRDHGVVEFLGQGRYRAMLMPTLGPG